MTKRVTTQAKRTPSPHEVRLAPLDTNPEFRSLRDSISLPNSICYQAVRKRVRSYFKFYHVLRCIKLKYAGVHHLAVSSTPVFWSSPVKKCVHLVWSHIIKSIISKIATLNLPTEFFFTWRVQFSRLLNQSLDIKTKNLQDCEFYSLIHHRNITKVISIVNPCFTIIMAS